MKVNNIDLSFSTSFDCKGKCSKFYLFPQQVSSNILIFYIYVVSPVSSYKRPKGYVYYDRTTEEVSYDMPFYNFTDYRTKSIFTRMLGEKIKSFDQVAPK